jgi:hypothetical protein
MDETQRFIDTAHEALSMNHDDETMLRMLATIDLLTAALGITEEMVTLAYANRLRTEINKTVSHLSDLAGTE